MPEGLTCRVRLRAPGIPAARAPGRRRGARGACAGRGEDDARLCGKIDPMKTCDYCYMSECCPAAFDQLAPCPFASEGGFVDFRRGPAVRAAGVSGAALPAAARERPEFRAKALRGARFR